MIKSLLILFSLISLGCFCQEQLSKDHFYVDRSKLPENYKALIEHPKGWRVTGRFNCYTDKIDKAGESWDTLHQYTSFERDGMYCRIKGNKIVFKGDVRRKIRIIYVDTTTLITEYKGIRKIKDKDKLVKIRSRYSRVT